MYPKTLLRLQLCFHMRFRPASSPSTNFANNSSDIAEMLPIPVSTSIPPAPGTWLGAALPASSGNSRGGDLLLTEGSYALEGQWAMDDAGLWLLSHGVAMLNCCGSSDIRASERLSACSFGFLGARKASASSSCTACFASALGAAGACASTGGSTGTNSTPGLLTTIAGCTLELPSFSVPW